MESKTAKIDFDRAYASWHDRIDAAIAMRDPINILVAPT